MQDQLSQTFSALADPTRRAMLARLSTGEANVSELAEPFLDAMSLPAVTKHTTSTTATTTKGPGHEHDSNDSSDSK